MEANELLTQLTPGQRGIIYQGLGNWRQVCCQEVLDEYVTMLAFNDTGEGQITLEEPVAFKTRCKSGLLRAEGTLENIGTHADGDKLQFTPVISPKLVSRRQSFRVETKLRARLVGAASDKVAERYDYEWEGTLRNLSVGGANLILPSPGPAPKSLATISFSLPTQNELLEVECEIIAVFEGVARPPLDTTVHLKFTGMNSQMESQLGRYINWVQLEARRKWQPL